MLSLLSARLYLCPIVVPNSSVQQLYSELSSSGSTIGIQSLVAANDLANSIAGDDTLIDRKQVVILVVHSVHERSRTSTPFRAPAPQTGAATVTPHGHSSQGGSRTHIHLILNQAALPICVLGHIVPKARVILPHGQF